MGSVIDVDHEKMGTVFDTLPPKTFVIRFNRELNKFFLFETDTFSRPKKYYGDVKTRANRILKTALSREASTGVLLVGEKGSGKTLLARETALIGQEKHKMPCLLINEPYMGDAFFKFLSAIKQPTTVMIDEFEKVYSTRDRDLQEGLLTLLDGVYRSQKLFLLTSNDADRINENMINRPGRIYYTWSFNGVSEDFIRQYCVDNLKNKEYAEKIVEVSMMFDEFNFDMLQAIVNESNLHDESPIDFINFLNVKPESSYSRWSLTLILPNGQQREVYYNIDTTPLDPDYENITVDVYCMTDRTTGEILFEDPKGNALSEDEDDSDMVELESAMAGKKNKRPRYSRQYKRFTFSYSKHFKGVDKKKFVYIDEKGNRLECVRRKVRRYQLA